MNIVKVITPDVISSSEAKAKTFFFAIFFLAMHGMGDPIICVYTFVMFGQGCF